MFLTKSTRNWLDLISASKIHFRLLFFKQIKRVSCSNFIKNNAFLHSWEKITLVLGKPWGCYLRFKFCNKFYHDSCFEPFFVSCCEPITQPTSHAVLIIENEQINAVKKKQNKKSVLFLVILWYFFGHNTTKSPVLIQVGS